jgi:hypothetical protein
MANFNTTNQLGGTPQAMTTTYKTVLSIYSSSGTAVKRGKVYDVLVGVDGTPADNAMRWDISRQTAAGTATSVTPLPLDPADTACLSVSTANSTAEPTITANSSVFNVAVNQRASFRWVAAPGSELVYPATNLAGFALRANSPAYTGTVTGDMYFQEQ